MTVVGIDAGYSRPGLASVSFLGPVFTLAGSNICGVGYLETERLATENETTVAIDDTRRITELTFWLRESLIAHRPDLVVVELPLSGGRSAQAIKGMAMAAGYTVAAVTILSVTLGFKTFYYSPYETKRVCAGRIHAEKCEMIDAALKAWPDLEQHFPQARVKKGQPPKRHPDRSEAIADAACAVLTHVRMNLGKPILPS